MKFKRKFKETVSLLLILTLISGTIDAKAFDHSGPIMFNGNYYENLETAIEEAQETQKDSTIYLYENTVVENQITIKSENKVNIVAEEQVTISVTDTAAFLLVEKDAEISLCNITVDGDKCGQKYSVSPLKIKGKIELINSSITKFKGYDSTVSLDSGSMRMDSDSYISYNSVETYLSKGGGVYMCGKSYLYGGNVCNNSSTFSGGGIEATGEAYIENVTIENNKTFEMGAGINVTKCKLFINNCTLSGNYDTWNEKQMGYVGNDLFVDSSEDIEIYNTKITAKKDDSGYFRMYLGGSGNKIISGLSIIGEKDNNNDGLAINGGKTIIKRPGTYNTYAGEVKTEKNIITGLNGKDNGAGLYIGDKADVEIEQLELTKNVGANGGAIYNSGKLLLDDVTIADNDTDKKSSVDSFCGKGIYQNGEITLNKNANISDQIYLTKDQYITVAENLLYHTGVHSAINITIGEDNLSENRTLIRYSTQNSSIDAFSAVQNGIFKFENSQNISDINDILVKNNDIVINSKCKNVTVKCVDENKKPIVGLKLDIYKKYNDKKNVKLGTTAESDNTGHIVINGLNRGEYYFLMSGILSGYEYDRSMKGNFVIADQEEVENVEITLNTADLPPNAVITSSQTVAKVNENISYSAKNSTDDKGIKSYYWDFGDGTKSHEINVTHKYADEGTYTVSLSVTDKGNNVSKTTCKITIKGIPEKSQKTIVNVLDTDTEQMIKNAYVEIWKDDTTKTIEGKTNEKGMFNCYLMPGEYTAIVYCNGYYSRSTSIVIGNEGKNIKIPLNTYDTVGGSLTVKELSLEEIKKAGIDTTNLANRKVTKETLTLNFGEYIVYKTGSGKTIKKENNTGKTIYEVANNVYLITGGVSWLKQIFDVELLVINNSKVECMDNVTATLNLPKGLSLADMQEGKTNTKTVNMGKINPGDSVSKHWYVRGDEDGIYNFDVSVSGSMVSPDIEPQKFNTVFSTTEPVYVYSNDVLFLNIIVNRYLRNGSNYEVTFEYMNVSPRTLYDVNFNLDGYPCRMEGRNESVVKEMKPGERAVIKSNHFISFLSENDSELLELKNIGMDMTGASIPYQIIILDNFSGGYAKKQYSYQKQTTGADPVNMLTGGFEYSYTDMKLNGKNPLTYERYYNSKSDNVWTDNYSYQLSDGENMCRLSMPGGYEIEFKKENGRFQSEEGSELTLEYAAGGYVLKQKNNERYYFDKSGRLIEIAGDKNRNEKIEYTNNQISKVYSASGTLYFEWNENGNITKIHDKNGYSTLYSYESDKLTSVTNADGNVSAYKYDENGYLCKVRDFNGVWTISNTYDKYGRVTEQELADGGKYTFSYDPIKRYNECKGENNYFKAVFYNEKNQIITDISNNGVTSYEYNEANQIISGKDGEGKITYYSYDENNNLVGTLYPDGTNKVCTYENNRIISETDENGGTIKYDYDTNGNITSITDPMGNVTAFEYDKMGNCISKRDSQGNVSKLSYDERGNCIMTTDAVGNKTYLSYDLQGKTISSKDAMGNVTKYNYTAGGKFIGETDADGKAKEYGYNSNGYTVYEEDKLGNKTLYDYDEQNHLKSSTSPLNNTTKYQYDSNGNLTVVTDANGHTSTYTYDGDGNIVGITDALGNSQTYDYDKNGNIISIKDNENNISSFKYDDKGRKISETDNMGNTKLFTYDNKGNILSETDAAGSTIHYQYDANGNQTYKIDANGNKTQYEYDSLGRLVSETDAVGQKSFYEYDAVGNLTKITDSKGNYIRYEYNKNCKISKTTDKNGRSVSYTYDSMGNIISSNNDDGSNISYSYDANGNLLKVKDERGFCISYAYDGENRKISEKDKNGNETKYKYDKVGNLIETIYGDSGIEKRTYNAINLVTSVTDVNGFTEKYEYNKLGNVVKITGAKDNVSDVVYDKNGNTL